MSWHPGSLCLMGDQTSTSQTSKGAEATNASQTSNDQTNPRDTMKGKPTTLQLFPVSKLITTKSAEATPWHLGD